MNIATRLASTTDKDFVWTLYESAMRAHIEAIWGWDPSWQRDYFDKAFFASATYIVEVDTKPCGYIQLDINDTEVYLSMIVLTSTVRSKGVGAALLQEVLRCAHRSGRPLHLRVFRVNGAARRFYEREGWIVQAEDDVAFKMTHPLNDIIGDSAVALPPESFEVRINA